MILYMAELEPAFQVSPEDLDRALSGHLAEIASLVAPCSLEPLLAEIRQAVERKLWEVKTPEAFRDLVVAAARDAKWRPLIERAQAGSREAFDELWTAIRSRLRPLILTNLRIITEEYFGQVEQEVALALWMNLKKYDPRNGFFLTWARAFARHQAKWFRPPKLADPLPDFATFVDPKTETSHDWELPPSHCFQDVLETVVQAEPCRVIIYLYNRYLRWEPERVVEELSPLTLHETFWKLRQILDDEFPGLRASMSAMLKQLEVRLRETGPDSGAIGDRKVGDCLDRLNPAQSVSRLSGGLHRSVCDTVIHAGKKLLRTACKLSAGAHEKLAFLCNRFLQRPLESIWQRMTSLFLFDILEIFRREYSQYGIFTVVQTASATIPLDIQISGVRPPRRLAQYFGEDALGDLVHWRDRVQALLLAASGGGGLAYAYLCGWLPGLYTAARREKK